MRTLADETDETPIHAVRKTKKQSTREKNRDGALSGKRFGQQNSDGNGKKQHYQQRSDNNSSEQRCQWSSGDRGNYSPRNSKGTVKGNVLDVDSSIHHVVVLLLIKIVLFVKKGDMSRENVNRGM